MALWLSFPLSQAVAITDVPSGASESPCPEAFDSPSGFSSGKNERPKKGRPKQASDPGPTPQGKNKNKEMETTTIMTTTTTTTTTTTKSRDGERRSAIEEVSSAAQGTKNGIEESKGDDEKKESSRTSGCDKNYDEGTPPQRSLSLLRSAEDMRAVRSRVNIIN